MFADSIGEERLWREVSASEERDVRAGEGLFGALAAWLIRPLSDLACLIGWIVSSIVFFGLTSFVGGPAEGDAAVSVYSTWAIAHGRLACAYPGATTFRFPSIADPYTYIAPLYPLFSGAVAALARIGHAVPFPTSSQMGPHCSTAAVAMFRWSGQAGAILPTVRIGYLCWLPLMIGAILLLRAAGRGNSGWEVAALLFLAILPSVMECITDYFHPQDLLAMGLLLIAVAAVLRGRWVAVGVFVGLAILTNQFALLVAIPLLVLAPSSQRVRYTIGAVCSFAIIALPFILLTSGRAAHSVFVGSGFSLTKGGTVLWELHATGATAFIVERLVPILLAAWLAWWSKRRLGDGTLEPTPLLSVLATALALRLVFEITLWPYYFMAAAVLLVLLEVIRGRIRGLVVGWLAMMTLAFDPFPLGYLSNGQSWSARARELLPNYFIAVAIIVFLIGLLRRQIRWSIVAWIALVVATLLTLPWSHQVVRSGMPLWFWQIVLAPSLVWLVVEPLLHMIRTQGLQDQASTHLFDNVA
jgi:hypothetical protein